MRKNILPLVRATREAKKSRLQNQRIGYPTKTNNK
jgi:hypothetical protein